MLLINADVQKYVLDQINHYLLHSNFTFTELKAALLSKSPIIEAHNKVTQQIEEEKNQDLLEVTQRLESQAFKNQLNEDKKERTEETKQKNKLKKKDVALIHKLEESADLIRHHDKECLLLRGKIALQQQLVASRKSTNAAAVIELNQLEKKLWEHEVQLMSLNQQTTTLESKLQKLKTKLKELNKHQMDRHFRSQARKGYNTSTKGIYSTLSDENALQLKKNLESQLSDIEERAAGLISDAETINYPTFIEQVESNLSTLKLSSSASEAITNLLKYMKLHIAAEQQLFATSFSASNKKKSIAYQLAKLERLQNQLEELKSSNPKLTIDNTELLEKANLLEPVFDKTNALYQKLNYPLKFLTIFTLVSLIPLILTFVGIIPFFLAPAILYSIFAIPPSLLGLTTIGLGIGALVYYHKAQDIDTQIKGYQQMVKNNQQLMKSNCVDIKLIESRTIPNLKTQIGKDEKLEEHIELQLTKQQSIVQEYFDKASSIAPINVSSLPGAKQHTPSPDLSIKEISSADEDSEVVVSEIDDVEEEEQQATQSVK